MVIKIGPTQSKELSFDLDLLQNGVPLYYSNTRRWLVLFLMNIASPDKRGL